MSEVVTAARAAQLAGVSEKTMLRWLAAGKVAGARKVQPLGEPARWDVPVSALEGLPRLVRPPEAPENVRAEIAEIRRRLDELLAQVAALRPVEWSAARDVPLASGGEHSTARRRSDDESPVSPPASSESPLSASGGHSRSRGPSAPVELPPGHMLLTAACEMHNLAYRTVIAAHEDGRRPLRLAGSYQVGVYHAEAKWVLGPEGLGDLYRHYHDFDSGRGRKFERCSQCPHELPVGEPRDQVPTLPAAGRAWMINTGEE